MASSVPEKDVVEAHLDEIELLRAMYPSELVVDDTAEANLTSLREWCRDETTSTPDVPKQISLNLNLDFEGRTISINTDFFTGPAASSENGLFKLRIIQPSWMTKTETARLNASLPSTDIFSTIEHVQEAIGSHISNMSRIQEETNTQSTSAPLVRVWFYFPSISTREKRDDIVKYAPSYGLTGFLLAGKPGILCLEGVPDEIDEYMRYIKTVSWGDIPSQHKKVSERHRESDMSRVFPDMVEITEQIEKRGQRGNRGDMKGLETWLEERNLKDALEKILM